MGETDWDIAEPGKVGQQTIEICCLETFILEGELYYAGDPWASKEFFILKKHEGEWSDSGFITGTTDELGRFKFKIIDGGQTIEEKQGTCQENSTIDSKGHYWFTLRFRSATFPDTVELEWLGRPCNFCFKKKPKQIDIIPESEVKYEYQLKDSGTGWFIFKSYKVQRIKPNGDILEWSETGNIFNFHATWPYGRQKLKWVFEDDQHALATLYWEGDWEIPPESEGNILDIGIGKETQLDIIEPREKKYYLNAVIGKFKKYRADAVIWGVS